MSKTITRERLNRRCRFLGQHALTKKNLDTIIQIRYALFVGP